MHTTPFQGHPPRPVTLPGLANSLAKLGWQDFKASDPRGPEYGHYWVFLADDTICVTHSGDKYRMFFHSREDFEHWAGAVVSIPKALDLTTPNWSEYTVTVKRDPCYYGSEVSQEEADALADHITAILKASFRGIHVRQCSMIGSNGQDATSGPYQTRCDEIDELVASIVQGRFPTAPDKPMDPQCPPDLICLTGPTYEKRSYSGVILKSGWCDRETLAKTYPEVLDRVRRTLESSNINDAPWQTVEDDDNTDYYYPLLP